MNYNNLTSNTPRLTGKLEQITGALLGAAVGDALGWPFEGHASKPINRDYWKGEFLSWEKKSGSRFRPTTEYIGAGEYSDDTQLLLAIARSRKETAQWWIDFATCELPFWTLYERGGGGATKRAAASWLSGKAPWLSLDNEVVQKYFAAGGNGVAMRILPHCIYGLTNTSFKNVAVDILTDGVITHGHPRAIIGALAYGFSLWYALKVNETLKFGEIIDASIENVETWGSLLDIEDRWPEWKRNASKYLNYDQTWKNTIKEMLDLLEIVKDAAQAGALSFDDEVLNSIGAVKSKISGAGTVSAAAAIYFASRYAADPSEGILRAASAVGSDTDTIASMSGALLGAFSGKNWLNSFASRLQDHSYIRDIGLSFISSDSQKRLPRPAVGRSDLTRLIKSISTGTNLESLKKLPNALTIDSINIEENSRSELFNSSRLNIKTYEGITLYIKNSANIHSKTKSNKPAKESFESLSSTIAQDIIGISLAVSNLEASRTFYENILGLSISGETSKTLRFGTGLALREEVIGPLPAPYVTIFLQAYDLEGLRERMVQFGYPLIGEIIERSHRRSFECTDPDGYIVEVVEVRRI